MRLWSRRSLPSEPASQYNFGDVLNNSTSMGWRVSAVAAICLLATSSARAEEADKPLPYQGAYWGLQTHGGLLLQKNADPGLVYGVSARLATMASLLDIQATVLAGHYGKPMAGRKTLQVDRLSVGFEAHAHPFLVLILKGDFFNRWLAGLFGILGLDYEMARVRHRSWRHGASFKLGVGSEVPLTDPDRGWSVWLGLNYYTKFTRFRVPEVGVLDEHVVLLTVGYRNNDIYFARTPRPEEVLYRQHPLDD